MKESLLDQPVVANSKFFWNVVLLSTGFFGIFLAYNTTQALETTLVNNKTLADVALAVLYATFTLLSVPAPKVVQILGPKLSMMIGSIPYVLGCLANISPSYALTVPAFGLIGAGAGLLWTGQAVYLSRCAIRESLATGERQDRVSSRFNGMFYAAFQFNGCIGSLIAAAAFTGSSSKSTAKYLYIGLAAAAAVGSFILWFLRSMPTVLEADTEQMLSLSAQDAPKPVAEPVSLVETLRLAFLSPRMRYTIPIIMYNGMSLGFFFSDFPGFYAKKGVDILLPSSAVGYVTAMFYAVASLASYLWGRAVPRIGRAGCMAIATCVHIVWYVLMLFLSDEHIKNSIHYTSGSAYFIPFAMAAIFALGDSVWESQPPAVVQSSAFFPEERDRDAAQGNLKVWQSLGFAIQFALGFGITNIKIKLGILLALQVLAALSLYHVHSHVAPLDGGPTKLQSDEVARPSYGSVEE